GTGVNFGGVAALATYGGELIAGGNFTTAGGYVSENWARWAPRCPRGDMNCDGRRDGEDIGPFLQALVNPAGYATDHPICTSISGDFNGDDQVTAADVDGFVSCLVNGDCP